MDRKCISQEGEREREEEEKMKEEITKHVIYVETEQYKSGSTINDKKASEGRHDTREKEGKHEYESHYLHNRH